MGIAVKVSYAQDLRDTQINPVEAYDIASPRADSDDDLSLEELDEMLPEHLRRPLPLREPKDAAPEVALQPTDDLQPQKISPPTPIEKYYRDISGDFALKQFGYDFLGSDLNATAPAAGAVQGNYILGVGDRLNISFLGERKDRETYTIDRAGSLNIDLLPPVAAAGKTLDTLRNDVQRMMDAQSYHGEIYMSLEHVRQIGILVAGYVMKPGRHSLSPLQTVLEALEQSGGVTPDGSLRQIRLIRDGTSTPIDLYAVMNGTNMSSLPTLQDGDRIIVPPLGPTLAVIGDVRQPGIYELPMNGKADVIASLAMAGGPTARGENRITLTSPQNNGKRVARLVSVTSGVTVGDGAIIAVNRTMDRSTGSFMLTGETRKGGTYALGSFHKLSQILHSPEAFGDDVYPLMGVVSRRRDSDLTRDLVAFSPQDVFAGRADVDVKDGDSVRLLSTRDVKAIMNGDDAKDIPPLEMTFVHEHAVSLQGAVRLPGLWPVAGPVSAARILDVAGGALSDADISRVEISRNDVGLIDISMGAVSRRDVVDLSDAGAERVTITFGDAVRIPDRFEAVTRQTVTLRGEVRNPGTYDLMRGDTLMNLIDRAGGLTDQAYPLGTVFSRAAERKREKEKFNIAAHDLERSIAMAADNKDGKVNMEQIAMAKDLVDEMKTIDPVGRITVESDPGILRRDPNQDILLESGDKIYIPKRPLTVRVTGEVMSPASLQFRADKNTPDYVSEAGGLTMHADKSRIFILFPNGAAQPVRANNFTSLKPLMITPGSTIVVPRDPKPFDFMESAKDITQILSNIAITGIYADDLLDKN